MKGAIEATIVVDLRNVPEIVWGLRREMAMILRDEAEADADPRIARRLRALADGFEAGQHGE